MNLFKEILSDFISGIRYFMKSNIRYFANIVEFVLPYMMFMLGMDAKFKIWFLFIPVCFFIIIYIFRSVADKLGTGNRIPPVPGKRFTQVDDGEVSIENNRVQELILYMADLEDWMERKNIL